MSVFSFRAIALAPCALLGASAITAQAASYKLGGVDVRVDTTISAGVSVRTTGQDAEQIAISNGGSARSANGDDGNLGYKSGDVVASALKVTSEFEFSFSPRFGLFSRVSAFYNPEANSAGNINDRLAENGGAGRSRVRGEAELGDEGHDRLDSEIELLDFFFYGDFRIAGRRWDFKIGNQVASWGESTFIRNGINVLNPIDVLRFRLPGSEIKEALIPTPMIQIGGSLTDNLSAELIWMANWRQVEIDPRGSFFSTNDFASDDGDKAVVSFGRRNDDNTRPVGPPSNELQAWSARQGDREPVDEGRQGAIAFRYFAESLNATEFGLYYVNYHSRLPLISAVRGASSNPFNLALPLCSQDATVAGCRSSYFVEYPEDIQLWGLSFNTNGPWGVAVQGELSYRPNNPVQISGAEVLLASLVPAGSLLRPTGVAPGTEIRGWEPIRTTQAQLTFTKAMGPSFGASQWVIVSEFGYTNQQLTDGIPFNGPGAGLPSCNQPGGAALLGAVSNGSCQEAVGGGYATQSSWGYRIITRLDYNNVIGAINISPRLIWVHDVNGVSGTFNEGAQILGLGLRFDYLNRWQADIAYTRFLGGRTYSGTDPVAPGVGPGSASQSASFSTHSNPSHDRDFLAVSVSRTF